MKPGQIIATLKSIAQMDWDLVPRPGRLEELQSRSEPSKGMSISYGCGSIRVRLMDGRTWANHIDMPGNRLDKGDLLRFQEFGDGYFKATPGVVTVAEVRASEAMIDG